MKRTISKSERPYRLLLCVMISLLVIMLAGCSTSSDSDTMAELYYYDYISCFGSYEFFSNNDK